MTLKTPTPAQVEALAAYAAQHGRTWRARLLSDWVNGRCTGELQQLRNQFGPRWLLRWGRAAIAGKGEVL